MRAGAPTSEYCTASWGGAREGPQREVGAGEGGGGEGGGGVEGGVLLRKTKGFKQKEGSEGGIGGVDGLTSAGHRCII